MQNKILKDILDVILYDNPSTQDEIAEKLGISRRYVAKLLKPLFDDGVVKRVYILDLKKCEEFFKESGKDWFSSDHSAVFLIKEMLKNMFLHVSKQLEVAFTSVIERDEEKANLAMEMDYTTNNMFEKVRSSVETILTIDSLTHFSKILIFPEIAYSLERIGDYCDHFSKFTINENNEINENILNLLKSMYKFVDKIIHKSMDAFLNKKISLKGDIMDLEKKIHKLQKKIIFCISHEMSEVALDDTIDTTHHIYLSRLVKSLERIGDICVEILDIAIEFHKNIPRPTTPKTFRNR